ncbi:alpha/beta fold hydrolase [Micromonospora chaiyaphumensis]|uniref:Pimeloyl-ACP methyl ester carboxylesterase n=1 Tax=Micromonospora chaiyaphumensis TaxID=307119 RepID=A0A1C4Z759_9ACTN|nr:alpha/beta hydrolase [Micromonospora chaiyaphumensis]SCF28736.1 Pimeloyl-ACP methyl ester carboxylesterase [Micromonospora chaiyaphumensis]
MSSMSTAPVTTGTLAVPDGRLYYEVRGRGPLVALVAAPMDADAFAPLADLLATEHTVLTTDPRGIRRSVLHDPHQDSTPELRADDVARLLAHVDAGPAAVLGSSGGAVTVLALAQAAPAHVHTVVAHEPPLLGLLPDRAELLASEDDMIATYRAGDRLGAGRKFLAAANIHLPEEVVLGMFGGEPDPQAAADEHFQYLHMIRGTTRFRPDVDALRDGPARVVVGLGEQSTGEVCDRTSRALAAPLGTAPTMFPGGHLGFAEDPPAFADRLREVLAGS